MMMVKSNKRILIGLWMAVLALWMVPAVLEADPLPELVTDRPDFTESGVVVPKGHFQFEAGGTWVRFVDEVDILYREGPEFAYQRADGDIEILSGPELLLRVGILNRLELRLGFPDYIDVSVPGLRVEFPGNPERAGFGDSSIGTKVQLGPVAEAWDVAAIATLSLPTGEDDLTSDAYDPDFILTLGRDLGRFFSVGTQLSAGWPTEGDDRTFLWGGTFVVGASFCERWGTFVEVAYEVPEEGEEPVVFHYGYTMMIGDNFQLDIHGGTGLNDAAPDFFLGGGLSLRL